jgi:hypothetical protein
VNSYDEQKAIVEALGVDTSTRDVVSVQLNVTGNKAPELIITRQIFNSEHVKEIVKELKKLKLYLEKDESESC